MKQDLRIKMFDRRQQIQNNSALKSKLNEIPMDVQSTEKLFCHQLFRQPFFVLIILHSNHSFLNQQPEKTIFYVQKSYLGK